MPPTVVEPMEEVVAGAAEEMQQEPYHAYGAHETV
jgi:hypothetical protein